MRPIRSSFWTKCALTLGIVALADSLLFDRTPGAGLGLVALAIVAAVVITRRPVARGGLAGRALIIATIMAAVQIERASLMAMLLYAGAIGVTVLAPRAAAGEDVWRWQQRMAMAALKGTVTPFRDFERLLSLGRRRGAQRITAVLLAAGLPLIGGGIFLSLFAAANPLISEVLSHLRLPALDSARLIFWGMAAWAAWTALRPRGFRNARPATGMDRVLSLPGVTSTSVTASLLVFNAVFALQNGLDLAYLWGGAALPAGMTLAAYAHRGAYPLIATALLAGLFVLVFLRPDSATARARWPRLLVTVWVGQNLLLVASTALRTLDYVEVYSLTRLRIAALAWMALVAVGLVLICWRLLRARSASWLINANALAAGLVLTVCSFADLGAIAASWNVIHAREVGGRGQSLDLCYLRRLDGAAIVPLAELARRPLPPEFKERVIWTLHVMAGEAEARQEDWRSWRWRDARRLARVQALTGLETKAPPPAVARTCQGIPKASAQLTPRLNTGT
jgi:hypothetical protein